MPSPAASSSLQNDDAGEIKRQILNILESLEKPKKRSLKKAASRLFSISRKKTSPLDTCRDLILQLWSLYPENYHSKERVEVLKLEKRYNDICQLKKPEHRFQVAVRHIQQLIQELSQETLSEKKFNKKIKRIEMDIPYSRHLKRKEKEELLRPLLNLLDEKESGFSEKQRFDYLSMLNTIIYHFRFERLDNQLKQDILNGYAALFISEFIKDYYAFKENPNADVDEKKSVISMLTHHIKADELLSSVLQDQTINEILDSFAQESPESLEKTLRHHMNDAAYGYSETLVKLISLKNKLLKNKSSSTAASSSDNTSQWRERKNNEQEKIIVHSYDFDGCTKERFIPVSQYAKPDLIMIGSTRQSQQDNVINKDKRDLKADAFHMLLEWHIQYEIPFMPLLYADIDNELPYGTAFNSKQLHEFSSLYDNTKISLIFSQIWAIAMEHSEQMIDFHFFDDREEILLCIQSFYSHHPDLIPGNLNLHLHQHAPRTETHRDIASIQGCADLQKINEQNLPKAKSSRRDIKTARLKAFLTSQKPIHDYFAFADKHKPEGLYQRIINDLSLIDKMDILKEPFRSHIEQIMETSPYPQYREEIRAIRNLFQQQCEQLLQGDISSTETQQELIHFFEKISEKTAQLQLVNDSEEFCNLLNQILEGCQSELRIEPKDIHLNSQASSSYSSGKLH